MLFCYMEFGNQYQDTSMMHINQTGGKHLKKSILIINENIEEIIISQNVRQVKSKAFALLPNLQRIIVDENNRYLKKIFLKILLNTLKTTQMQKIFLKKL